MVAVGLLSAKGSPGCTTTALALSEAWPDAAPGRRILLAECDVAGGDIASGYLTGGCDPSRGVLGLALSRTTTPIDALWDQLLTLDDSGQRLLLLGISDARQAVSAREAWPQLSRSLPDLETQGIDILLDLGRMHSSEASPELRDSIDLLVLVTRSSLHHVASAQRAADELRQLGLDDRSWCLVVDEGQPYRAPEIARALDLPLIGSLALEGGHHLAGGRQHSGRGKSGFARHCRQLVSDLLAAAPSRAARV